MSEWARNVFGGLSLEQKVGQVICCRGREYAEETLAMAREGLVGSVSPLYYAGTETLMGMLDFINALQEASPVPILFMGGWVHEEPQLGATPFPGAGSAMLFGAARNWDLAYRFGKLAARESKAVGLDLIWEPCVDVNTNARNPIIGTRAFSDRPELVIESALAMVRGMQEERVIPNAKHFPGHGDTDFDSHVRLGVVPHDRARLDAVELAPYRALIAAGLRGIETAHLIFPALEPEPGLPATFSRRCIHDLLRAEMGFQGLIVSDSLTMRAIKDNYSRDEAVVQTFSAGHDVILQDHEESPRPTFDALLDGVKNGRIAAPELDAAVMRILEAKEWVGLPKRCPIKIERVNAVLGGDEHAKLARELFAASVTLLENDRLPLRTGERNPVCVIATMSEEENTVLTDLVQSVESAREIVFQECRRRLGRITTHALHENPDPEQINAALAAAKDSQTVLFATSPRIVNYKELSGQVGRGQVRLVEELVARGTRVLLCVFGVPYAIPGFPRAPVCLTTYSANKGAIEAGLRLLFGEIPAQGKLPVTLSNRYPFGYGL